MSRNSSTRRIMNELHVGYGTAVMLERDLNVLLDAKRRYDANPEWVESTYEDFLVMAAVDHYRKGVSSG